MAANKETIETEKVGQNFEKDSKLCWLALACGFLTQVLILGVLHAFGVFFIEFIKEFKTTKGEAAWVGSVAYGLSMFVGPVAGMIMKRFGHKSAMVLGGLLCSIALFSSSYVESFNLLFFTFSFIYGIGTCMSITPTMTLGQDYFDKYLGLSIGIMTSGSSIGTLIMAPTTQALIDAIGWRNTFRLYSGTCLLTSILDLFIRPITNVKKTPTDELRTSPLRRLIGELALWRNRVFIVWTIGITLVMFGYYIPYVHLVSFALDKGCTAEQGSILIMVFGASTATGRLMFGKIVQLGLLKRLHMHQLSMILSGTATMFLPLISSFPGILSFVIFFGLVDGCFVVLLPLMTCSLVRTDKVVIAWSFLICCSSITFTLGPPVAGFMYDALGSYNVPFHIAGIPVISGALVLFLIPWAQRTSDSKKDMEEIEEVVVFEPDDDVDYITLSRSALRQGSQVTLSSVRNSIRNGESLLSYKSISGRGTPDERHRHLRYYRQREIELPLTSIDRNIEYRPDMMSIASRRTVDSIGRSIASGRDSRGVVMGSKDSRSIAMSSKSVSSEGRPFITRTSIGIQTDDISINSSCHFLPSSSDIHCQFESKHNDTASEMSRTSILENSITSGQIEPFVMEQIERLGETLNSPTRAAELMENPNPQWIKSPKDEVPAPVSQTPVSSTPARAAELTENPNSQWIKSTCEEVPAPLSQTSVSSTPAKAAELMENTNSQSIKSSHEEVPTPLSQTPVASTPARAAELMENTNSQRIKSPHEEVPVPLSQTALPSASSSSTPASKPSSPKEIVCTNPVTFDELLVPAETVSCALSPKNSPIPSVVERKLLFKQDESAIPTVSSVVEQNAEMPIVHEKEATKPAPENAHSTSPSQKPIESPLSTNPHNEQPTFLGNQEAFKALVESTNEMVLVVANEKASPVFSEFGKTLKGTGSVKKPSPATSVSRPSPPSSSDEIESEKSSTSLSTDEATGSTHDPIFNMEQTPPKN